MNTKNIIEKWYKAIGFDAKYNEEFYSALESIEISADTNIGEYDLGSTDGKRNLLAFLYMCEEAEKMYEKMGIDHDILLDTLKDISRWLDTWSNIKGEMYLGELGWLSHHLKGNIFKLGRLQYCKEQLNREADKPNFEKGDNIVGVHIPSVGPLKTEDCYASLDMARAFFAKYFPEREYNYFVCHSWLLDDSLKEILPPDSNIIQFGDMFDKTAHDESDDVLKYVFRWDAKRDNFHQFPCKSSLAQKVKERVLAGGKFYCALGFIDK